MRLALRTSREKVNSYIRTLGNAGAELQRARHELGWWL